MDKTTLVNPEPSEGNGFSCFQKQLKLDVWTDSFSIHPFGAKKEPTAAAEAVSTTATAGEICGVLEEKFDSRGTPAIRVALPDGGKAKVLVKSPHFQEALKVVPVGSTVTVQRPEQSMGFVDRQWDYVLTGVGPLPMLETAAQIQPRVQYQPEYIGESEVDRFMDRLVPALFRYCCG